MKPLRDFKFANKKEVFACVGFRYDQPQSLDYRQFKAATSVAQMVQRLLTMEDGADVISIRRVYLMPEQYDATQTHEEVLPSTEPPKKKGEQTLEEVLS